MVTFICGACQATLKKNQVNKHCETVCPNAWTFTCIDCAKDFKGFEFDTHTSCITESEKYFGKFHKPKEEKKKTRVWKGWRNEIKYYLKEKGAKGVDKKELKKVILERYRESNGKYDEDMAKMAFKIKLDFYRFIKKGEKVYYYRFTK
ncbi:unnamed protein product [Blepharisma stoltei]|uniref:Zinc finger C2H2 LYAR-type domain-containing protein n=1 Tax=Blepharisma stoltei TaxID=1481888 RepID=A0AAU9JUK0_9CILI|nr:unnamed protein product [Blepharisma stoltei]